MLMSIYSENIEKVVNATDHLTEAQIKLLNLIRSKGRFEQLMEVLPEDWEEKFEIMYYDDPSTVAHQFREEKRSLGSRVVYDRKILSIIFNKQREKDGITYKYNAIPAKYDEHRRRDYDYPIESNIWKLDTDLSEYRSASFHVDHKLIWIAQHREVDINSETKIENVPYKYSINIYVPTEETLIEVEKIKKMGTL